MFCPRCKAEYEPHVKKCKECDVPLIESLPPEPPPLEPVYQELVTVYTVPSPALMDMAQSILQSAEIKYFIKGELIQNIIALGTYGGSFNLSVGPPEIQVAPDDAEEARILLNELSLKEPEESAGEGEESAESEEGLTEEEEEEADELSDELAEEDREEGEYEDDDEEEEEEEPEEEAEAAPKDVKETKKLSAEPAAEADKPAEEPKAEGEPAKPSEEPAAEQEAAKPSDEAEKAAGDEK